MAATMYSVPLSQLSPFLCTECLYADKGHKKWSWQQCPPPWLKTIKSNVEIGRSLAVTDNSGTNVEDCKFPLPTTPCPQTYTQPSGGGRVCVTQACTHTTYSCWETQKTSQREKKKAGLVQWWGVGLELSSGTNGWTEARIASFYCLFVL